MDTIEITVDAIDPERVSRFWEAALRYRRLYERPPYIVSGPDQGNHRPRLVVQQVPSKASGKTAVHLDLRVADPAQEVRRLTALGARVVDQDSAEWCSWTVMIDPEGTHFCVCSARPEPAGDGGGQP